MTFQRESRDRSIMIIMNGDRGVRIKFNRYWPYHIYPCQKLSSFGVQVVTIPSFAAQGCTKLLWKLSALITTVEIVWQLFADATKTNDDWYGWLLAFLTKTCFTNPRKK